MPAQDDHDRSQTTIHLAHIVGASSASTWFDGHDRSITSLLDWRARHLRAFERKVEGQPDSRPVLQAWEHGFDEQIEESMGAVQDTHIAMPQTVPASSEDHDDDDPLRTNLLAMETCLGIHKCLELVNNSSDDNDSTQSTISVSDAASLLRFATASASMLAARLELAYGDTSQSQ